MKALKKILSMVTAATLLCSAAADAVTISGKSSSAREGERVGIRVLKDGYSPSDLTPQNASDIIVYQNQTVTGVGGEYSFDFQSDGAQTAYIGFGDSGITKEVSISEPDIYFESDFSDYGGGKGDFTHIKGSESDFSAYDFGDGHGKALKAAENGSSSIFKHVYADPYDMSKKLNSGVYRIAFDYRAAASNAQFTFRLLKAKIYDFASGGDTFETFAVNSETKLGFYEGAKGWTMHYPFYLQQKDKWYSVVMYVDLDLDRIVYYIDGKYFGISELNNCTSFDGIAFSTPVNADVYIDNMSIVGVNGGYANRLYESGNEPTYETAPLRSEIKTEKTGNIFGNEDTIKFETKYAPYDNLKGVSLTYKVIDENGEIVWSNTKAAADIKSGAVLYDAVLPQIDKYGLYTLNVSAKDESGASVADENITFSFVNSSKNLNNKFGIVNHIAHNIGEYDKLIETEKQAGFGIIRDELFWSTYERTKGQYGNGSGEIPWPYFDYYKAMKDNNIELLQEFTATNSLYTTENPPVSDTAVNAFADYAAHLAKNLIGTTNYFEVWNEYNLSSSSAATPENYVKMTKAVSEKVRAVNPDAKLVGVCAGQLAGENKIVPWITRFLNGGGGQYIDALSIHIYCQGKSPESSEYVSAIEQIRDLLDRRGFGDMPIWMTETGWSLGTEGIDDTLQAAYGVRANILCRQDDLVEKMFWYTSLKKHGSTSVYEYDLGIMQDVMQENPYAATKAYLAFSNYNALLADKVQNSVGKTANGVYKAEFEDDGEYIYAVWSDGGEKEYSADVGLQDVEVCDMFGNSERIKTDNGVLKIKVSDSPQYVRAPKFDYEIYCGEKEIKNLSDIDNAGDTPLKISVAVNRAADKTGKINNAAVICAAYKDGCLIDVSVCGDENSGLHGYARFKTEINAANADRISIFIRDKNLIKPIDMYEIR